MVGSSTLPGARRRAFAPDSRCDAILVGVGQASTADKADASQTSLDTCRRGSLMAGSGAAVQLLAGKAACVAVVSCHAGASQASAAVV